jgi:hypothetical protein
VTETDAHAAMLAARMMFVRRPMERLPYFNEFLGKDAGADASARWTVGRQADGPEVAHGGESAQKSMGFFSEIARNCAGILSTAGPHAVLAYLNSRTRFRFSAIYRADPPLLHNLYLFDRENPSFNLAGDVARIDETYCSFVCGDGRPFSTPNASRDDRLGAHVARDRVLSYCGAAIRRESGVIWGTLCHYDVRPRIVPRSESEVLEVAAAVLAGGLPELREPR